MPQQLSNLGFGTDASTLSGYALRLNDRFGAVDLTFENVGANTASLQIRELISGSPNYTYVNVPSVLGNMFTIAPWATQTKHIVTASQQIAIFGSGNTQVNVSINLRNPSDRRNPTVECIPVGKQNWGFAPGFNQNAYNAIYPNI